ncbi:CYTH domain-containing protein [Ferrimonas sediminicola]|uniref:CYTH domain-containing protein n=1 Tax=Ferrimonas sediminicola TaxID=2569538 RepID=A0A4U1BJT9_9GAMM|nr:CYTH domain-containing protein [Ferrimonas sediminicola]TKB51445.1 CYTH domain-containing protein [Ferrimonas sediminicola]
MEIELKLLLTNVDHDQLVSVLKSLGRVKSDQTHFLVNRYFDTPALTLRHMDIGLRVRQKGEHREQTVKTAGSGDSGVHRRPEYNVVIAGDWPELARFPDGIWQGTDIEALQAELTEQFATNFRRRALELQLPGGTELEVALDRGQVLAAGKSEPIDELELELISGDLREALVLAQSLAQRFCLRLGQASKAARGYRLADLSPLPSLRDRQPGSLAEGLAAWQLNEHHLALGSEGAREALVTQLSGLSQQLFDGEAGLAVRLAALGQGLMDAPDARARLVQLMETTAYGQAQLALLALLPELQED